MQRVIRESGDEMDPEQRRTFAQAYEEGVLGRTEDVARVYARFVASPQRELTGKLLKYVPPLVMAG